MKLNGKEVVQMSQHNPINLGKHGLVKLSIPSGWNMVINTFYYIKLSEMEKDNKLYITLSQDLMYIEKKGRKVTLGIDVGWYPDMDPDGCYRILVIRNAEWEKPLEKYESRDIDDIIIKVEEFLEKYGETYNYVKN